MLGRAREKEVKGNIMQQKPARKKDEKNDTFHIKKRPPTGNGKKGR